MSHRPFRNKGDVVSFTLMMLIASGALILGERGWAQSASASLSDPIKTDAGLVSGAMIGEAGKQIHVYRGIPYAAPPVGNQRWRPPQTLVPWQEVRKSTEFGPVCAQYFPSKRWNVLETQMSEDCLTLNVLTPANSVNAKLPVMVWLHPGGLDSGSGNLDEYNGPALPQHGVVLVTVNHRLGAFGLLAYAGLTSESPQNASGNYGMLDLIAALQWVNRNISAFGGDPGRVTIFGQEGGAQKVIWLLASPLAKGLFQRAIVESGMSRTLDNNSTRIDTEAEAYVWGDRLAVKSDARSAADLRARSWQDVVKAMPPPSSGLEEHPPKDGRMHPTIDAWSLTDHPVNILDESLGSDVPVLVGGDTSDNGVFVGYTSDWLPALTHRASNVYVYRFTRLAGNWKNAGLLTPQGLGVRYQFGYLGESWNAPQGRTADPGMGKDDEMVSDNMMTMWANFAAVGDPSVEGMIKWPVFKATPGDDNYVTIDVKPETQSGFLETFTSSKYPANK